MRVRARDPLVPGLPLGAHHLADRGRLGAAVGVGRQTGEPVGAAARVVQRVREDLAERAVLELVDVGAQLRRVAPREVRGDGPLGAAHPADQYALAAHADAVRVPLAGTGLRPRDVVRRLRAGPDGLAGAEEGHAVQLGVVQVDRVQRPAVAGDVDVSDALAADLAVDGVVVQPVVGGLVRGECAGQRDEGVDGGAGAELAVDRVGVARRAVGRVPLDQRAHVLVAGAVHADAEHGLLLRVVGQLRDGPAGGGVREVPGEGHQALVGAGGVALGEVAGDQVRVLLAVDAGLPETGGVRDVRTAGDVDEADVAAHDVGARAQARDGGGEGAGVGVGDLDAVLAAGELGRGREDGGAVGAGRHGPDLAGVVRQGDLDAGEARLQDAVVRAVRVHLGDDPHGHGAVAGGGGPCVHGERAEPGGRESR